MQTAGGELTTARVKRQVAVAGDVDPEKMLAAIQTFAGDAPAGRVPSHDIDPEPAVVSPRAAVM